MNEINSTHKPTCVQKLLVTMDISPYGRETEFFCGWVVEEVLELKNQLSLDNASLIFEVELYRRLKGTGFELHAVCNYGDLSFSFYLPMKKTPTREIAQLRRIADACAKDIINNYGLDTFKAIYDEWHLRQREVENDKGVIFDMSDGFTRMNIAGLKDRKVRQLANVYTYLAQRKARQLPHVQAMLDESKAPEVTYG